jgi:hypothetical protein
MFKKILNAARLFMEVVDHDYEKHTARGILRTSNAGHGIILAFDPLRSSIALLMVLPTRAELTMTRVIILLRLQNRTATRSSSITVDPESSAVRVNAHGLVPVADAVQPVVSAAFRDTIRVLEDDDFKQFIN